MFRILYSRTWEDFTDNSDMRDCTDSSGQPHPMKTTMKINSRSSAPLISGLRSPCRTLKQWQCGLILLTAYCVGIWPAPIAAAGKPRLSLWKSNTKSGADQKTPVGQQAADGKPSTLSNAAASGDARTATGGAGTVKLNYFGAGWGVVFKDLADATDSRLIANRIPAGTWTRRDSKTYTRSEAVRIINKEIEARGFRIVEQDELLVVLDIPSIRPRYQPAEIQQAQPRDGRPGSLSAPELTDDSQRRTSPAGASSRRQTGVRPAGHQTEQNDPASGNDPDAISPSQSDDRRTVVVFRARNRPVIDISREIYHAYPQRAELLAATGENLPGFRVTQASAVPGRALQLDLAIDEANEEVRIDVPKSQSASITKLFRALDVPARERSSVRLMSQAPAVCRIAAQLAPELEQLRQRQGNRVRRPAKLAARQDDGDDWLAEDDEEEAPQAATKPRPKSRNLQPRTDDEVTVPLPPTLTDVIGNLKGPVTIESFEDLGALILKGAAEDVEQVMQVIQQLEKLSEATAPKVHLLNLHHVDSQALAELLGTVFERLTKFPGKATQPRQNVAILPVSKPNAILIIAPAGDLDAIEELANELDQPVEPQTEFQVFPLKTAIASQVEKLLTDFYEGRVGLDTRILIRADGRSNTVIIRARPRDLDEAEALIKKLDRDGAASVSDIQIFPLTNSGAAEMAAILNQAIQSVLSPPSNAGGNQPGGFGGGTGGGGQVDEQFRDVKSTVLQFLAVDAEGERKLRSGLLADIRITPDPRMNALVVAAPERSMRLISELIKNLDLPAAAVAEIKVFPLTNADAQRVVTQLQSLFAPQGQQQGGLNNQQRQQLGIQVVGAEDAGSSLIPLRFSVDTRTNSIIAIGGAEALGVVEAILYRLDEGDIRERQQIVYRLKNSPAANIANAVTQFLTSQRDLSRQDPNLVSSVEQLEREVIVVAEPVSNSLMISATPRYFNEIQRLVKKLDEPPAQVVIQALIVEVTLDNTDEFGIEFGFQDSVLFNRSLISELVTIPQTTTAVNGVQTTSTQVLSQTGSPGFNFANPAVPLGNNVGAAGTQPAKVGTQGLSNFSLGRVNGDLGFGGLVLSAGSESVNVLLRALSASRRLQVLSRPLIRTMDNQTAMIQRGQIVPVVNGVQISANGLANPQILRDPAGIILTITPRISPDGQIVMDLVAEKSEYLTTGVPIFTDANTGNVIEAPIKDISTAQAVVSVPSNQTVVIGGLISTSDDRLTRKVPWLGDIPILGYAFRFDSRITHRKELLIFLTPRLIREDADSELIKDVEMARMHFIEAEAEELHGPLRGVPAPSPIMEGELPWLAPGDVYGPESPVPVPSLSPSRIPSSSPQPDDGPEKSVDEILQDSLPNAPPPPEIPQTKSRRKTSQIEQAVYSSDSEDDPKPVRKTKSSGASRIKIRP